MAYGDVNRAIGLRGDLPWLGQFPADMKHFVEITTGQAVIMGRNTYDSISPKFKPLRNRQNIVMTQDDSFLEAGVSVAYNLDEAFDLVETGRQGIVIGGMMAYKESVARADELGIDTIYVTEVHGEFDADAFFPDLDPNAWREVKRQDFPADERNSYPYSFVKYERI